MNILESLSRETSWHEFITYKKTHQHLNRHEEVQWQSYIEGRKYLPMLELISHLCTPDASQKNNTSLQLPLPMKREINKTGSAGKRVIYSYPDDFNRLLKLLTFNLYVYDDMFAPNCYAFRRGTGVKDAVRKVQRIVVAHNPHVDPVNSFEAIQSEQEKAKKGKYCLKVDISNYFNSIDVNILLDKLDFVKNDDPSLFSLFKKMLTADASITTDAHIIHEKRGAMAGTPVSPFFANVYLMDVDRYFHDNNIGYFRYSDDILIFADTREKLMKYQTLLFKKIEIAHLSLNPDKVRIYEPGEAIEFLGFKFNKGEIDISDNTKKKMKARIKRKSEALRRWARKKHLSGEHAAKGFIKAMNRKFYVGGNDNDFSWSRWFFPNLTTVKSLAEIDTYMQEYIRYCVTGRHYKGNYRITYDRMKAWGYRNLVHEYYNHDSGS